MTTSKAASISVIGHSLVVNLNAGENDEETSGLSQIVGTAAATHQVRRIG